MPTLTPQSKPDKPKNGPQRINIEDLQADLSRASAEEQILDSPLWANLKNRLKIEVRKQMNLFRTVHPQAHIDIAKIQGTLDWIEAFVGSVENSKAEVQAIRQRMQQQKGSV